MFLHHAPGHYRGDHGCSQKHERQQRRTLFVAGGGADILPRQEVVRSRWSMIARRPVEAATQAWWSNRASGCLEAPLFGRDAHARRVVRRRRFGLACERDARAGTMGGGARHSQDARGWCRPMDRGADRSACACSRVAGRSPAPGNCGPAGSSAAARPRAMTDKKRTSVGLYVEAALIGILTVYAVGSAIWSLARRLI